MTISNEQFKEFLDSIYTIRMLVFMEVEPQSNKYNQVLLDRETYMKVSEAIASRTGNKLKDGTIDEVRLELSQEVYTLPDLQDTDEMVK